MIKEITSMDSVTGSDYVLYFTADWCQPCKQFGPIMDSIADEYGNSVEFFKVNIGVALDIAAKFGVMSVPSVIRMTGGRPTGGVGGSITRDRAIKLLGLTSDSR